MSLWLVTGGSGFLGRHLLEALAGRRAPGVEVVVLGRRCPRGWPPGQFVAADLDDPAVLGWVIAGVAPDVVLHLAGQTPPASDGAFYRGNTMATVHLLDALRDRRRPVRVVLAGSAAELGPVELADLPVNEDHPCRPADGYGLSKYLALAAGLVARPPLEVVAARIFNPVGPGLPATLAFGRFAAMLAGHDRGSGPLRLEAANLDARRDFVDARDVARALIALAERGPAGRVYHVGTGHSRRVGDGLDHLIRLSGREVIVSSPAPATRPDHSIIRGPSDSRADFGRIAAETGWRPEVDWLKSLEDLWDEARDVAP